MDTTLLLLLLLLNEWNIHEALRVNTGRPTSVLLTSDRRQFVFFTLFFFHVLASVIPAVRQNWRGAVSAR